ncbi:unnamed protein product, partial [Rotaria magnacalcarata]
MLMLSRIGSTNNAFERLTWPPFSPDMNCIESLCDELER